MINHFHFLPHQVSKKLTWPKCLHLDLQLCCQGCGLWHQDGAKFQINAFWISDTSAKCLSATDSTTTSLKNNWPNCHFQFHGCLFIFLHLNLIDLYHSAGVQFNPFKLREISLEVFWLFKEWINLIQSALCWDVNISPPSRELWQGCDPVTFSKKNTSSFQHLCFWE